MKYQITFSMDLDLALPDGRLLPSHFESNHFDDGTIATSQSSFPAKTYVHNVYDLV